MKQDKKKQIDYTKEIGISQGKQPPNSVDFEKLIIGTMLIDKRYNRKIIAINLHSYFGGEEELVHSGLTRIKEWMKTSKLTPEAVHDLYELTSTIKHLTELKGGVT